MINNSYICEFRAFIFDQPTPNNTIYTKDSISESNFQKLIDNKQILSYEIDDIGVKFKIEVK